MAGTFAEMSETLAAAQQQAGELRALVGAWRKEAASLAESARDVFERDNNEDTTLDELAYAEQDSARANALHDAADALERVLNGDLGREERTA